MNEYIKKRIIAKKMVAPIISENSQTKGSGIYLFERTDENNITFFYCGQARSIINRICEHWNGYQRIDISMRKRGFKSPDNPYGWSFKILEFCPEEKLDERESYWILENLKQGKQTYNITYGKQGVGKQNLTEGKAPKGYRDGVDYGYLKARQFVAKMFTKNLVYTINGKETVNKVKAYQKFHDFIDLTNNDENEQKESD